jgi:hypothetical protein
MLATDKDVNFTNITISGGADQLNYTLATTVGTATADISARTLALSNFTADTKVYDGTTDVTGDGFDDDRIDGDELTFSYDVAFEDANVGEGKNVNFTNIDNLRWSRPVELHPGIHCRHCHSRYQCQDP